MTGAALNVTDRTAALDRLLDKDALRELAMRYCRAIDRRDIDLLRSVYHAGAIDEHGTVYSGPAEEFAGMVCGIMSDYALTAHYIANTSYRIDGDKAEGELYFQAYHRTSGDPPQHAIVLGRYLDCYERRDNAWGIVHRRLVWDSVMTLDMAATDVALLGRLGDTGGDVDDPSYAMLPLLVRGR